MRSLFTRAELLTFDDALRPPTPLLGEAETGSGPPRDREDRKPAVTGRGSATHAHMRLGAMPLIFRPTRIRS
jgi:hypothetical protein